MAPELRMWIEHSRRASPIRSICPPVRDGKIGSERISSAAPAARAGSPRCLCGIRAPRFCAVHNYALSTVPIR
jgi:hypothetical protein